MERSLVFRILEPEVLEFIIPIAVILVGGAIAITKLILRHKERIAWIEQGIDPDAAERSAETAATAKHPS